MASKQLPTRKALLEYCAAIDQHQPPDRLASSRELHQAARVDAKASLPTGKSSAAWMATKALLIAIGGMSTVAYLASLPPWLVAAGAGVAGLTWFALYNMLLQWKDK